MKDDITTAFIIFAIILLVGFIVEQVSILAVATKASNLLAKPFLAIGERLTTDKKTAAIYSGVMLAIFIIVILTGRYGNGKQAFEVLLY